MNIVFVADVFADEVPGGGELVNDLVIDALIEKGHHVAKRKSSEVTDEEVQHYIANDHKIIVANHISLPVDIKITLCKAAEKLKYKFLIYEHDHKYLASRDPSKYKNFTVPDASHIDGDGFYIMAAGVLCQSKIHRDVLLRNIPEVQAYNLECSVWSEEFIEAAENLAINKNKTAAIIKSSNLTKNQAQAEAYCKKNNIEYDLISAPTPKDLLKVLSEYEQYVFFPSVLETFCRVIVEAKLAGCKIITNPKLLGVASEEWFKNGTREDILFKIKSAKENTVKVIEDALSKIEPKSAESKITVILNSYRRPYNLEQQIKAIREQTIPPKEIWLWINDHEDNRGFDHTKLDVDKIFHNNHNWKFYGRFAAALLADTEYVAIFDDDTIPGKRWFENCHEHMKFRPAIYGSAGVVLNSPNRYVEHQRVGWPTQNEDTVRVDLVGHAWYFKRDWLQYLWREKPHTWDNGEDIQFSYLAQKYGNIQTFVPYHPPGKPELHGSILGNELGVDDKATSTNSSVSHQQFFSERDSCVLNAIRGGWQTVNNLKEEES